MPLEVRTVLDVQEGDIVELEVVAVRRRGAPAASRSSTNPTPEAI